MINNRSSFISLQNELFPKQSLQERNTNFSELYLEFGKELIPVLNKALVELKPFIDYVGGSSYQFLDWMEGFSNHLLQ